MATKRIHRNGRYLAWLRTQPCCVTGATIDVQAAHTRLGLGGGMGIKPTDYRALPLQAISHRTQHQMGERAYWASKGRDPEIEVVIHLARYVREVYTSSFAVSTVLEHCSSSEAQAELLIELIEARRPTRYKK